MALPLNKVKIPGGGVSTSEPTRPTTTVLPEMPDQEPTDEQVDGISELDDEHGEDAPFSALKPKAAREAGAVGKPRRRTQKEEDYVDFILKAGAASTHTISRLHAQSRASTYRKLKWLKDNDYLDCEELAYGPPLWYAANKKEVRFSSVRHLYNPDFVFSLSRQDHDQIIAYLAAEWIGGLTDNFNILGGKPADPILAKVASDSLAKKGDSKKVTMADYAQADAVRRNRLGSTSLTKEIESSIRLKKEEIKRVMRMKDLRATRDDVARAFFQAKVAKLRSSANGNFDVSPVTGHSYIHPVSHDAWMAGVPISAAESITGEARIFIPDAVFYDERVGRLAIEVERSPKNRADWWEKLWAYYKHNEAISKLDIGGKTGGFYYDYIIYVFVKKNHKENFIGMLQEMRDAEEDITNRRQKELVRWLDNEGALLVRDLTIPKVNWSSDGELVSYIERGGALAL